MLLIIKPSNYDLYFSSVRLFYFVAQEYAINTLEFHIMANDNLNVVTSPNIRHIHFTRVVRCTGATSNNAISVYSRVRANAHKKQYLYIFFGGEGGESATASHKNKKSISVDCEFEKTKETAIFNVALLMFELTYTSIKQVQNSSNDFGYCKNLMLKLLLL